MILLKTGGSNEGMLSVSEAILNEQQAYYESLYATQSENYRPEVDVTPFVEFHTRVLNMAAANLEVLPSSTSIEGVRRSSMGQKAC